MVRARRAHAGALAERAMALAPDLPAARLALAMYYYNARDDYESALAQFTLLEPLLVSNADAHMWWMAALRRNGQWRAAIEHGLVGVQLDPRNDLYLAQAGLTFTFLREYAQAQLHYERATEVDPTHPAYYLHRALLSLRAEGRTETAHRVVQEGARRAGREIVNACDQDFWSLWRSVFRDSIHALLRLPTVETPFVYNCFAFRAWEYGRLLQSGLEHAYYDSALTTAQAQLDTLRGLFAGRTLDVEINKSGVEPIMGMALAGLGRTRQAKAMFDRARERLQRGSDRLFEAERRERIAEGLMVARDIDAAIEELEWLLAHPSRISVGLLRVDPMWDELRDDQRFQALLERYGN